MAKETEQQHDKDVGGLYDGKYRVEKLLGKGGMGQVFRAIDTRLDRPVALKVLSVDLQCDTTYKKRLKREARAAAAIGHPNIVNIYEVGETTTGSPYIAMELLEGHDLAHEIKTTGQLPLEQVLDITGQVLLALSAAHRAGVIHRDLKPGNIFLCKRQAANWRDLEVSGTELSTVKLLDFGISRRLSLSQDLERLTDTGSFVGTPVYMAPEQHDEDMVIDERADIYSVGVVLFQCLTGQVPFREKNLPSLLLSQLMRPPPSARDLRCDLPEGIPKIIQRAMATEPTDRFQTANEFILALRPFFTSSLGQSWSSSPPQLELENDSLYPENTTELPYETITGVDSTPLVQTSTIEFEQQNRKWLRQSLFIPLFLLCIALLVGASVFMYGNAPAGPDAALQRSISTSRPTGPTKSAKITTTEAGKLPQRERTDVAIEAASTRESEALAQAKRSAELGDFAGCVAQLHGIAETDETQSLASRCRQELATVRAKKQTTSSSQPRHKTETLMRSGDSQNSKKRRYSGPLAREAPW